MLKDTPIGGEEQFSVTGTVMQGKHLGHKLGFPTVNLPCPVADDLPPNGVHAAVITILSGPFAGEKHICVLNQGSQPTVPIGFKTIEAYILNFSGDLYGAEVRINYVSFRRPENKFESVDALKAQIEEDTKDTLAFFGKNREFTF